VGELAVGSFRRVVLSGPASLRPAARQRDTTVPRLIADVIEAVAADGLVTAVLDDDRHA
jgi:hypothetical protein